MKFLRHQVEMLETMAKAKIQANYAREAEFHEAVEQLLRVGVCPCIVQGRYSTCCEPKLGDLT